MSVENETGTMKNSLLFYMALAVLFFSAACRKIEQLPPEPSIEFRSFQVIDTTDILGNDIKGGRLKFYFEDGDGNLGLKVAESGSQDTVNLFFTLYRKNNGLWAVAADNDPIKPSDYRIPYMERTGQNKILRGTVSVTFMYFFYEPALNDTIMYDFYIKDRAGNQSNVVSTPEIALSVNNTYIQ